MMGDPDDMSEEEHLYWEAECEKGADVREFEEMMHGAELHAAGGLIQAFLHMAGKDWGAVDYRGLSVALAKQLQATHKHAVTLSMNAPLPPIIVTPEDKP